MELERENASHAEQSGDRETVLIGVGLSPAESRALRAFDAEGAAATQARWLEAATVDGATARVRVLRERGVACVGW